MTTPVHITDHEARALARLIEQYKGKGLFQSILTSNTTQLQELEDVLFAMITNRSLDDAEGEQLDRIGAIVGVNRTPGDDDAAYRLDIAQQIAQNTGFGTPENLIDALIFLTGSTVTRLEELYPGGVQAEINVVVPPGDVERILEIMQGLCPAGVMFSHAVSGDLGGNTFCFEDGDGGGFGDHYDGDAGGRFASLIGTFPEGDVFGKSVDVSFVAATIVDVDTAALGMNAQRCVVQIIDMTDDAEDFDTADLGVHRPDSNTIRLTSGIAITRDFRILVVETEEA